MSLIEIHRDNAAIYLPQILEIEANSRYPFGDDSFTIDHGTDYFKFFKRMGTYHYYAWIENGLVCAVICLVLRQVTLVNQSALSPAWYLCDLKVHPHYRGQNIILNMIRQLIELNKFRCQQGYAVSMNHAGINENRMAKFLRYFRLISIDTIPLSLWSLDAKAMALAHPMIEQHRGPTHYSSLKNIKDIVLSSTKQAIPLLHAQFGPMKDEMNVCKRDSAAIHMFCSPSSDKLTQDLESIGLFPSSTATILAHQMPGNDWKWILTSEI